VFFTSYSNLQNFVSKWGGPDLSYDSSRGKKDFFKARSTNPDGVHVHKCRPGTATATSSVWARMLTAKNVIIESRSPEALKHGMSRYNEFIKTSPQGCLLLSVCRGRLSEGYDFSDGLCRGVIIVGLPYVSVADERVKLKRSYMDERCATLRKCSNAEGGSGKAVDAINGAQWYQQSAFRAINQALGRLIRHKDDFGAVILMDSRFEEASNQAGISKWIRGQIGSAKFGKTVYVRAKRAQ
jgi:regulator of telomere elongation helicase 1